MHSSSWMSNVAVVEKNGGGYAYESANPTSDELSDQILRFTAARD